MHEGSASLGGDHIQPNFPCSLVRLYVAITVVVQSGRVKTLYHIDLMELIRFPYTRLR